MAKTALNRASKSARTHLKGEVNVTDSRSKAQSPTLPSPIEYWHVERGTVVPRLRHMRATFYEFMRWADHPWGADGGNGKDFDRDWAIEIETDGVWRSTGRANDDWMERTLARENVWRSREDATAYIIYLLENQRAYLRAELAEVEAAIATHKGNEKP